MLELIKATKVYRMGDNTVRALKGIDLKIEPGDFVAIMGPSGSGKSTLMNILGLLDVPTDGSYLINNQEVSNFNEDQLAVLRRNFIGFVFQQFNLLPRMTACENVALPLLYSQGKMNLHRAQELLRLVGLSERGGHRSNELSGGQQQRVAIARSLTNKPSMILADEPTGNLDSASSDEIMKVLADLNAQGITIALITHEDEIARRAKRIIRLRDGVILSDERLQPLDKNLALKPEAPPTHDSLNVFEHFRQGLKNLAANKIRTGLSMLGILIGVAAVVAMLALGGGAQKEIEEQLKTLGSNLLVLRPGTVRVMGVMQGAALNRLSFEDAQTIKEAISGVREVAPMQILRKPVIYQNKNWQTEVIGSIPAYDRMHASVPQVGRFFTEEENQQRARVAVIGATIVRELFGDKNPIGEMIKIEKTSFQVIGILPEKGHRGWRDQDDAILIPFMTAMRRLFGREYVDSIEIEMEPNASMEQAQTEIENLMVNRHRIPLSQRADAYYIRNMAEVQEALSESNRTMSLLLATIAAISLVVGGIGIMNIMLVSVTERTREIGLRKAIGGRRVDIMLQFLIESVVVSSVGGIIGILFGWLTTIGLTLILGWSTAISISSVLLSFFFSAGIGVLFGIYPAKRASELAPIEALRYE